MSDRTLREKVRELIRGHRAARQAYMGVRRKMVLAGDIFPGSVAEKTLTDQMDLARKALAEFLLEERLAVTVGHEVYVPQENSDDCLNVLHHMSISEKTIRSEK